MQDQFESMSYYVVCNTPCTSVSQLTTEYYDTQILQILVIYNSACPLLNDLWQELSKRGNVSYQKKKIKLAKGSKTPSVWHHLWNGLSFLFDKIDLIYQTIWIYMSYLSR